MSFRKSFYLGYPVGFTGFKFTEGCPTGMTKADLPVQEGQWVTFGPLVRGKPFYSGRLFLRRGFWFVLTNYLGDSFSEFSTRFAQVRASLRVTCSPSQHSFALPLAMPSMDPIRQAANTWAASFKKRARKDPVTALHVLKETAHEHGVYFVSSGTQTRRNWPLVSRHHRLSNPRPPVYRAPAFQIPAFEMVATGVMH